MLSAYHVRAAAVTGEGGGDWHILIYQPQEPPQRIWDTMPDDSSTYSCFATDSIMGFQGRFEATVITLYTERVLREEYFTKKLVLW